MLTFLKYSGVYFIKVFTKIQLTVQIYAQVFLEKYLLNRKMGCFFHFKSNNTLLHLFVRIIDSFPIDSSKHLFCLGHSRIWLLKKSYYQLQKKGKHHQQSAWCLLRVRQWSENRPLQYTCFCLDHESKWPFKVTIFFPEVNEST